MWAEKQKKRLNMITIAGYTNFWLDFQTNTIGYNKRNKGYDWFGSGRTCTLGSGCVHSFT